MSEFSQLTLKDGNTLCYALYGARDLVNPVIYFHGFPGSRLEGIIAHQKAAKLGITIIAVDRPGFGHSSDFSGRRILDIPDVVRQLTAHLGVSRFGVLSVSGGTPYALATAWALPSQVSKCVIVSGVAPQNLLNKGHYRKMVWVNRLAFRGARDWPRLSRVGLGSIGALWRKYPRAALYWLRAFTDRSDRKLLEDNPNERLMFNNVLEGLRLGGFVAAKDFALISQDWGFALGEIKVPTVIWHGATDIYVPPEMGEELSRNIPAAQFKLRPGGGHFMILRMVEEVLREFISED